MNFKLFPFLQWNNVKKLSDSFEKKLYDDNQGIFSRYGFLSRFNDVSDSFGLIKTAVVIQALLNKRHIETEADVFTDVELSEESKNAVIHARLPYMEEGATKIYVPFFSREFNVHYDSKLDSLTRFPFDSLKEDFESSVVDPFDTYGYRLFDSQFTRLIKIREYPDEKAAVFYHLGFETIYVINDQGSADTVCPIFDSDLADPVRERLFERIDALMRFYFADDRRGFVDGLSNFGLISPHLYALINKNLEQKEIRRLRLVARGKDL